MPLAGRWLGLRRGGGRGVEQHAYIVTIHVHGGHVGLAVTVEVGNR